MTSSARTRIAGEIAIPIALAVLRFGTNSNLVASTFYNPALLQLKAGQSTCLLPSLHDRFFISTAVMGNRGYVHHVCYTISIRAAAAAAGLKARRALGG